MVRFSEIKKILLGVLVTLGFVAVGLLALFVMLWLALLMIAGFFFYGMVRRVLPRKPRQAARGGEVIEGEFRIERNERKP